MTTERTENTSEVSEVTVAGKKLWQYTSTMTYAKSRRAELNEEDIRYCIMTALQELKHEKPAVYQAVQIQEALIVVNQKGLKVSIEVRELNTLTYC
jgi:hypothetical protein